MKKLFEMLRRSHRPDIEALSAYVEGQLEGAARATLDAHVATCAPCQDRVAALTALRTTLGAMPEAEVPRSFRLRRADIEAPARASSPARQPWAMRFAPAVAGVAVAVFAVVLGADLATREEQAASGTLAMRDATGGDAATDSLYDADNAAGASAGEGDATPAAPAADSAAGPVLGDAATLAPGETAPVGSLPAPSMPEAAKEAAAADGAAASATAEQLQAAALDEDSSDGGNRTAFRVVEVIAAAFAAVAGAGAFVAWRRGRQP